MARYGLLLDVSRCIGCHGCVVACKQFYKIAAGIGGRKTLIDFTEGDFPNIMRWIFSVSCMQCDKAPCIPACPAKAIYRREDGIVAINKDKCVGAGDCITACPYSAPYIDPETNKADICDLCASERDLRGEFTPYCVQTCSGEALIFGDLDDPLSEISKAIRYKNAVPIQPELGTKPKVYYANLNAASILRGVKVNTGEYFADLK